MRYDESDFVGDDVAEIWRSAQRRRAGDVYAFFANLSRMQPHVKPFGFRLAHPLGYVGAWLWKWLTATRTESRTTH